MCEVSEIMLEQLDNGMDDIEECLNVNQDDLLKFCMLFDDNGSTELNNELERTLGNLESEQPEDNGMEIYLNMMQLLEEMVASPALEEQPVQENVHAVLPEQSPESSIEKIPSSNLKEKRRTSRHHPYAAPIHQSTSRSLSFEEEEQRCLREYADKVKKAEKPTYTHRQDSVLVDQGFIKYEVEVPNNPEYKDSMLIEDLYDPMFHGLLYEVEAPLDNGNCAQ